MKSLMNSLLYFSLCAIAVALLLTTSFDAHATVGAAAAATAAAPGAMLMAAASAGIQALREKRNDLAREIRNELDKHPKDKALPKDVSASIDAKMAEVEGIDARINQEQKLLDLSAEKHFKGIGGREAELPKNKARAVFATWLRKGDKALSNEDWETLRNDIPEGIRNTMSTTTGSEGGNTVQSDVARELINSLKEFGGMREVSEVFVTEGGNPLSYPTSDGTSEVGELVAENASATDADPTFGTVSLNTFKYSSKVITVPIELLMDSEIDVEALVRGRLQERLGRITNQHFTTGSGSGQPRGVVTGSSAGKVGTTGQTTTVIYDDLVDLQHSVDPAYRKLGAGFMMADSSLKVVRKLKDSQNRPIFVPGYEAGVPGGMPDSLLGAPLHINNDVAAMAANAKSILFGHYKKYKIRDVLAIMMFRFTDSAYAKKGQVGFLAFMRAGGNLVDTAAVKHYANSAT